MSSPVTADDFLQLVRKSNILDESKLSAFLKSHEDDGLLQQEAKHVAQAMVREGVLTRFQAEQFLLGKWRGFELGKYRLLERIGVGGLGQVFLCEHKFMRKRVAIKVLPPHKAEDPVTLGRFYREARVASALDHPNIVRTFDIDQEGPLHFLVMEYVDGASLLDIVKKHGAMNIVRACHYIQQAANGLQYGFQTGMIHRDIKPGNIMVDREGTAKILDMGLARFYRDDKDQLTLKYDDKNVLGTADYVAPEQTRDSRNIDVRADIYGLGATLYFVLAGQPPFAEGTVAEKLIAHQMKKPKPIREVRPEVPQGLAKVVEKMLAKDPADRYQTPQEVSEALEVWTQAPIEPPPPEEMPKLSLAAQPETFGKKPPAMAAMRETAHTRAGDTALGRTPAPPRTPGGDSGVTLPLPFRKPAPTPAAAPAASITESASVVDLVVSPPQKTTIQGKSVPELDISETRPIPSDPTPQSEAAKPPEKPKLDIKIPGFDLSRLQKLRSGSDTPSAPSPQLPESVSPKPVVNIPKPQSLLSGSRDIPKPQISLPGSRDMPKPPPLPGSKEAALPGTNDLRLPLPGSKELAKPPLLPSSREAPKPLTGSREAPKPLTGSREAPKPAATQGASATAWPSPTSSTPVYRPPELMPFFSAPAAPKEKSNAGANLFRWLFMMVASSLIGAALGTAIWYLFLR